MAPRRGPRRNGTLRRSPRLHPQIHVSEDGAGVTRRRSRGLDAQIRPSEDGAGVTRRRRHGTLPPESPLDSDDMLREILLRLPPKPSSLPRASAVCKRWRCLVTDPKFHRQFYAHHRKPPLLGFIEQTNDHRRVLQPHLPALGHVFFNPILDRLDRIPPQRFSLVCCGGPGVYRVLNCRHGLVLVQDWGKQEVVVCAPLTGEEHRVAIPPDFKWNHMAGAVLCATSDVGHVHGGCHSSPFKVVLLSTRIMPTGVIIAIACVYSSQTGKWGNVVSTPADWIGSKFPPTLIGSALYWLSQMNTILECDLDGQSLAVTTGPPVTYNTKSGNGHIIQGEDGAVGVAILSSTCFQTWQRKVNCYGVATWVSWKTIELHTILGRRPSSVKGLFDQLLGYDEDNGVILLYAEACVYTVQLMSMQSRKLYETRINDVHDYHPFTSFFTPGIGIAGS